MATFVDHLLQGHQEVMDYLIRKGSKFEAGGNPAKSCKCCGASDVPLKICIGCGVVCYWSTVCQIKDLKEGGENSHKIQCKRFAELRTMYVKKAKKEIEEKMSKFGFSQDEAIMLIALRAWPWEKILRSFQGEIQCHTCSR